MLDSRERLGLKIALWVASVLLSRTLTDEQRTELSQLRTSLSVLRESP